MFVIAGPTDDGEPLYWSNEDGWVDRASATVFDDPNINDPLGAVGRVHVAWKAWDCLRLNEEERDELQQLLLYTVYPEAYADDDKALDMNLILGILYKVEERN